MATNLKKKLFGVGFEPTSANACDLKSHPLDQLGHPNVTHDGDRTRGHKIKGLALCQLSYAGVCCVTPMFANIN